MTGPWSGRENVLALVGILLAASLGFCAGEKYGQTDEKLAVNSTQTISNDSATKLVTRAVDSARRNDKALDSTHDVIRTKVRVVRDSVFVRDTVYADADVAQVILAADSLIAAQKRSLALQDTLIATLRQGIALRDTRISILERERTPGKLQRIATATKYLAVGAVLGVAISKR